MNKYMEETRLNAAKRPQQSMNIFQSLAEFILTDTHGYSTLKLKEKRKSFMKATLP
jgi:hypothetical protein